MRNGLEVFQGMFRHVLYKDGQKTFWDEERLVLVRKGRSISDFLTLRVLDSKQGKVKIRNIQAGFREVLRKVIILFSVLYEIYVEKNEETEVRAS